MNIADYNPDGLISCFIGALLCETRAEPKFENRLQYHSITNISLKMLASYRDYKSMGLRNHYLRFCVLKKPEMEIEWAMVIVKQWGKKHAMEKMRNCIEHIPTLKEGWVVVLKKDNTLEYIQMSGERPENDEDKAFSVYLGFSLRGVYEKVLEEWI